MVSETPVTQTATLSSDPQAVNVPASGSVPGTGLTYPVITLKNTGAPVLITDVIVTNTTRGAALRLANIVADFDSGQYMRVTSATRLCEVSWDNVEWTDVTQYLFATDDQWLALLGGVQNAIQIDGCPDGELTVAYTPRWA
jgi:hypothetical protein